MGPSKSSRALVTVAAVCAATAGLAVATPASAAAPSRRLLTSTSPGWLARAHQTGRAASRAPVNVRVYLNPRGGEAALEAAVAAVSTPGSRSYGKFLTRSQYLARYQPTSVAVRDVSAWLRSSGFRITGVEGSHRYVSAAGDVAAAQAAFNVSIGTYTHDGQSVQAQSSAVSVPSSVADQVLSVTGLDTTVATVKPLAAPPPAFVNARPCSTYYGQLTASVQGDYRTPLPRFDGAYRKYAVCGYVPVQFRAAYEGATSLTGRGVTVAITDAYAAPTIRSDANTYATKHGDAAFRGNQFSQSLPSEFTHQGLCGPSGWYGEETLDVEAVHGMAPDANIKYYAGASCLDSDLLDALARVVDDNTASIVTNSWGEPDEAQSTGSLRAYQQVFLQGAMQGISFLYSSGDSGDELANTGLVQSDSPASSPYVTAVGGTSTAIGPTGALSWETGWGTHKFNLSSDGRSWVPIAANPFLYGAGGGYSKLFNRPAYQNGVVPATAPAGRAVPDVGMDADPTTGMLIGETQTFPTGVAYGEYRIGGTSLASPLFAGMLALALQHHGDRLGLANPTIYSQVRSGGKSFNDVTSRRPVDANVRPDFANGVDPSDGVVYSVRTFDQDSSLKTRKGWDDVTGVGSPNGAFLTSLAPVP